MPHPTPRWAARAAASSLVAVGLLTGCDGEPSPSPSTSTAQPTAAPSPSESLLTDEIGRHSAVGRLADDFPADLVPVPAGAEVLVSSAVPGADGTLQISLNVRTEQDPAGLLEAVRGPLLAAGFVEAAPVAPEPGLAAQVTFSRSDGAELLVVGVLDREGVRTMTLGGTVRAPAP
ncbi:MULTISPECIES: hypothetical protein [Cellulomonas]|uniref:hypothetical protein n=1 Tax=Cellulomonas TaxID=1707 RepID=UPI0010A8A106|nr:MULTISPECIES: hypothetical protein [Cellulomonas]